MLQLQFVHARLLKEPEHGGEEYGGVPLELLLVQAAVEVLQPAVRARAVVGGRVLAGRGVVFVDRVLEYIVL